MSAKAARLAGVLSSAVSLIEQLAAIAVPSAEGTRDAVSKRMR